MSEHIVHSPTPEFRAHLEEELMRTFRRENRLDQHRRRRSVRWMRAAAVALVCVALGTSAGLATAQIRDGARRDSLLEASQAEAALAALRLQLAQQRMTDVSRKAQVGAVSASSVASAELELRAMEAQAMRARYNIEEIKAAAQPPRDDLNAPLIGGRDFVKDRLQLDLLVAQQRLSAAEAAQADVERRVRVGAAPALAGLEASTDLIRARATMAVLVKRHALRREFVEKATVVEQLVRELEETQLQQDTYVAQQSLSVARDRLSLLERQREVGVVEELEVMKARVEVKEQELALQHLMVKMRALSQGKRDANR